MRLIEGDAVFRQLGPVWDGIAASAVTTTPFQRLAYQQAWWKHLGPGQLFTMAMGYQPEQVQAIGCFYLLDGRLYFNGCVEETDYLDLIAPASLAAAAWEGVFDMLESETFPAWRGLNLCNIPEDSPSRTILAKLAAQRGYYFSSSVQEVCPIIPLPQTFDDYLVALDKKQRHEIRRKLRRAQAAAVHVRQVQSAEELAPAVDEFLRLLRLSMVEKDDWLNAGRRALFHDIAAACFKDGTLQLLFLQQAGANAATLFNFDYNGRIWVYNSGMDIVEFGQLSPGVVLTAEAISLAIASGRDTFDFLRGNEEYKYRFGAQDTTIYQIQLYRP